MQLVLLVLPFAGKQQLSLLRSAIILVFCLGFLVWSPLEFKPMILSEVVWFIGPPAVKR